MKHKKAEPTKDGKKRRGKKQNILKKTIVVHKHRHHRRSVEEEPEPDPIIIKKKRTTKRKRPAKKVVKTLIVKAGKTPKNEEPSDPQTKKRRTSTGKPKPTINHSKSTLTAPTQLIPTSFPNEPKITVSDADINKLDDFKGSINSIILEERPDVVQQLTLEFIAEAEDKGIPLEILLQQKNIDQNIAQYILKYNTLRLGELQNMQKLSETKTFKRSFGIKQEEEQTPNQ